MNNTKKYGVDWKSQWIKLSVFWSKFFLPINLVLALLRINQVGFSVDVIFDFLKVSFIGISIIFVFMLLITFIITLTSVTIKKDEISGLNYWGFRKKIPFKDIKEVNVISLVSKNDVVVIKANNNDEILLSSKTKDLDELLEIIKQ
tara:strand:- start:13 stop:450 length:438 start_codon:yes stop_codon:yes gene_type:complete